MTNVETGEHTNTENGGSTENPPCSFSKDGWSKYNDASWFWWFNYKAMKCIFGFFSMYTINGLFCICGFNSLWSIVAINSLFSILSINSSFSILSINSAFSIGCKDEVLKLCWDDAYY